MCKDGQNGTSLSVRIKRNITRPTFYVRVKPDILLPLTSISWNEWDLHMKCFWTAANFWTPSNATSEFLAQHSFIYVQVDNIQGTHTVNKSSLRHFFQCYLWNMYFLFTETGYMCVKAKLQWDRQLHRKIHWLDRKHYGQPQMSTRRAALADRIYTP